jgi:oxygen-independent coproporphyrinogen-3 oxidase
MSNAFFNRTLIDKYNLSGPRYTSYPTAVEFKTTFDANSYLQALRGSDPERPLSLYLHVPFCDTLCYYCACNKIITKDHSKARPFIEHLKKEIDAVAPHVAGRPVHQMHWGGGTPTFLNNDEIAEILEHLAERFSMCFGSGEYGIEIDPRGVDASRVRQLGKLGFNRISFGVQDVNPEVQKAVHRIQPTEVTEAVLLAARDAGFQSINLDLIYGLPFQSEASFAETVEQVLKWRPDRLSVFNYAHLPHIFMPQKRIRQEDLPSPEEKLKILDHSISQLTEAGYRFIGMDHFALPDDELSLAQDNGTLYRNFQGYTTHAECELIGFGPSAISQIGGAYSQNVKTLEEYYAAIDGESLPVWRGLTLDRDDYLRREWIVQLICHFHLDFDDFSRQHNIDARAYFAAELEQLQKMAADGLLTITDQGIVVHDIGRLLIRNICMVFDKYLQRMERQVSFSRTI